ncbi:MAG: alpha/beta fold hydrolase, partial [Acidimicrobiaceae bacterium]
MKIRAIPLLAVIFASIISPSVVKADEKVSEIIETAPGISIDTSQYLPKKLPAPAILIAHGFGGSKDSVESDAKFFASKGFVVMTWSARGFGESTGQIEMNSIESEVADSRALITHLAKSKNVLLDGEGDPRVGIMGSSYGGANALLTASQDSRIDAVISDISWSDLEQGLFPQSVERSLASGPFKKVWAGTFFSAVTLQSAYLGECGAFAQRWCDAYQNAVLQGKPSPTDKKLLESVSPVKYASSISAPTLLSQGQADSLFPLSESYKLAQELKKNKRDSSLSMIWHADGHDGSNAQAPYLREQFLLWFQKHLLEREIEFPIFQFTRSNGSISLQDSTVIPKVFTSENLPFENEPKQLQLVTPTAAMIYPIGGVPSAISALPGIGSAGALASQLLSNLAGFSPAFLPGQSGLLESAPLTEPISVVGPSSIRVRITSTEPDATLFFSLVTKSPSGAINLPNGIVAPVRITNISESGTEVVINLPATILDASIGDVIAVGISSTDQGYETPKTSRFYSVSPLSPLSYQTSIATAAQSSSANILWPLGAFGSVFLAAIFVRIRRPKIAPAKETSDALVAVENLSKTYKDGHRAVVDLSFKVQRGQVVGLLGPNGAGKTTALRMIMGLIFPTKGSIYLNGASVYPGSPALSNIGCFIEGPGFLPHLSGRENL